MKSNCDQFSLVPHSRQKLQSGSITVPQFGQTFPCGAAGVSATGSCGTYCSGAGAKAGSSTGVSSGTGTGSNAGAGSYAGAGSLTGAGSNAGTVS